MKALAAGLVICAMAELLAGPPTRMPTQSRPSKAGTIQEWVKLAAAHKAGEADDAALTVSDWQASDLFAIYTALKQLSAFKNRWLKIRENPACPGCTGIWSGNVEPSTTLKPEAIMSALGIRSEEEVRSPVFTRLLFRAVLLHTDAAILTTPVAKRTGSTSPFTGYQTVHDRDGQQMGSGDAPWHLEFAAYLLDGVWPDVSADERARAWYDAVAVHLLHVSSIGEAEWLLGRAGARFPADARLAFLRGTVNETHAMPEHQQARRGTITMEAETHLTRASLALERALTLDPDFPEARLHAGRVASLLARHDRAADHLRSVAAGFRDPILQYYAAMFLGFEQEQTGDTAGARASYEHANKLFSKASSPLLALSALARRSGDSAEALASVRRLVELPKRANRQQDDPWWSYERSHVRDAERRLADWRARVSDGASR